MFIKFNNYSEDVHHFELSKSTEKLGLEESFFGDALLKCKMDKSHHQIVLDCELLVKAKFVCDRCNDEFDLNIKNSFQNIYLFGKNDGGNENANIYFIPPDVDKIVLDNDVFEYANLAIPLKILCSENCKGLCPVCGSNLNSSECGCRIDKTEAAWDRLKKNKNKLQ